jgi:glyoxylase-like metal-dependent hydrolase (beta-lactamase superfamily II)
MVEAMNRVWTKNKEPAQTAPVVQSLKINGKTAGENVRLLSDVKFEAKVIAIDREEQNLTYVWEILKEATVLGFGGSYEPRPERVGEVQVSDVNTYTGSVQEPGNYRLYVYVKDNSGFVSTANIPFQVTNPSTRSSKNPEKPVEVFRNNDLVISKLKDRVWVVETTDMTTMYIIEGDRRAMLIDTGTKCDSLDKIVRNIADKPLDVVITHLHPDHAGNIKYFNQIYLHPADTVLLNEYEYNGKISFMNDGAVFDLGGIKMEVALMPGHTPGSIVLLNRETGDCFSGDAFGSGQVWLQLEPHVPMKVYLESCKRMEQLMDKEGIVNIWCGHYPYVKNAFGIDYIRKMKGLAQRLANGDENGAYKANISSIHTTGRPMMLADGYVIIVYNSDKIN